MIKYIVIGSNNFWYGACSTKKEAMAIANDIKSEEEYEKCNFGDPESNYLPEQPSRIYVYKVEKLVAEIEQE